MLEGEIEAANERTALELEEQNKKTEQNFVVLKNYAEQERSQWEKRL